MGSSSSKAARRLPRRPATPWAGARTPGWGEPNPPAGIRAGETKDEAIQKDSVDPHFLTNLNRLGPVRVDQHLQNADPISGVLKSRPRSEHETSTLYQAAATRTRNGLHASSLFDLLEERKSSTSREEVGQLAEMYDMDLAKLESIARYVNSPSVGEGTTVKHVGVNGEETVTMHAVWTESKLNMRRAGG